MIVEKCALACLVFRCLYELLVFTPLQRVHLLHEFRIHCCALHCCCDFVISFGPQISGKKPSKKKESYYTSSPPCQKKRKKLYFQSTMFDCAFKTYKEARKRNENRKFDIINSKNFVYIIQVPIGSGVSHRSCDQRDPRIETR